ncbi:MAG: insulinase family protein, partial [Pyrinomonadaceae bacterium]|nr:insulinase family protein [Pyrinomonadaceae bacterium]
SFIKQNRNLAISENNGYNARFVNDTVIVGKPTSITVINLPDSGQAAVSFATKGIKRGNEEYLQGIVASTILGGGFSSRLNQEIRIKRGLSYGARSDLSARRTGGIFTARTQTKNESAPEVADLIVAELNRLGNEAVNANELTPRKATLIGNFSRELETNEGLVGEIAKLALYDINLSEINSYIQNVQAVSDAKVRDFAKQTLNPSNAEIVIVGDAKKFLPDLQKRFEGVKINVIPIAELDLNNADLRKVK